MYKVTQLCLQMLKELNLGTDGYGLAEIRVNLYCVLKKNGIHLEIDVGEFLIR